MTISVRALRCCWSLALAILAATFLCAPVVEAAERPVKKPLIIAISDNYPPFSIVTPTGEPAGLLVELWRHWSAATETPIRFRPSSWAETVEAVRDGRADIHSGLFKNAQRAAWMAFSEAIHEIKTGLFFKGGQREPVPLAELAGVRIGVMAGSFQEQFIRSKFPGISAIPLRDTDEMVLALLRGEIDVLFQEDPLVEASLGRIALPGALVRGDVAVLQNQVHAGVRKENTDLLRRIDEGLRKIPANTLARIERRWLPRPEDRFYVGSDGEVRLTPDEEAWLNKNPIVRLAVTKFITPVDIVGKDGAYSGLNADLIALLNAKLGTNIVPEFHDSWGEVVRRTLAGEVDGAFSLSRTPEREREVRFTKAYAFDPVVVVVRENTTDISAWGDLAGKRITLVKGGATTADIRAVIGGGTLIEVDKEAAGLQMVAAGEADAHVSWLIPYGNSQRKMPVHGLRVAVTRNIEGGALRIGVHKSRPQLYAIIRKGLNAIGREGLASVRNRWLSVAPVVSTVDLHLTADERAWLREHPKIRVHNETNWPPFNYSEDGKPNGFSIDYMNLVASKVGLKVEYVTGPTWNEFLGMMKSGDLDVMLNIVRTPDREKYLLYTNTYANNPSHPEPEGQALQSTGATLRQDRRHAQGVLPRRNPE